MKILVTGGAGFIGSHLCLYLLYQGHEIVCLDNFYTGSRRNIEELLKNKQFQLLEHDVNEPYEIEVDAIFNLACPASPVHYQKHPVKTVTTSVVGSIHALELSKRLGRIPVLQASTSEVYGDPLIHPQREDYNGNVNPISPRACYNEGKRAAETIFFDYYRQEKIPIKVVRIFNTYGPNMAPDDGRVISHFIIQALRGEDIAVFGDGSQTRSFCFVDDMVDGIVKMMDAKEFTGPVNLGNPHEISMMDVARLIIVLTKSASKIIKRPLPQDDPQRRKPDIALAEKKLHWRPQTPLETGLKKTIKYFQSLLRCFKIFINPK